MFLAALFGLAVTPLAVLAQERTTITGTVRTPGGAPVASATVRVQGTTTGAVTTASGTYRLAVTGAAGQRVTLRASKVGHSAQEESVALNGGELTQNFTLSEQAINLEGVVATASPTGEATRREIPNAVAQIPTAEIIERTPSITNVTAALQSRVPGVQVAAPAGTEGTAARVRIRGVSSISAGAAPVYVIDGVRMFGGTQGGFDLSGQSQSALDAISPQEIESIEVIKGPAAATLYGADAANGVIQIITKKGRPGQQRIQLSGRASYGEQEWGARTFTNYSLCTQARIDERFPANHQFFPNQPVWPGCQGVAAGSLISADLLRQDPAALRTGHNRMYHLDARGGGERFGFFLSGTLDNNDGVVFNNEFERIAARGNFTVAPSDKLSLDVNSGYYRMWTRLPLSDNSSNSVTRNANRAIPGRQGNFGIGWANLSPTEINAFDDETRTDRFIFSSTVRWQPFSWFRNRISGGFDYSNRDNVRFFEIDLTGKAPYGAVAATGARYQYKPVARLYTFDYAGTLSADFRRDLSSEFTFGTQVIANRFGSLQGNAEGLPSNNVSLIGLAVTNTASEGKSEQSTVGFFAQEQLGWRDRLFITAGLRTDDNSAFGEDFDFVVYPKLGASWVVSEEPFFSVPGVDQLRLRAAWGRAGNAPDPYSAERNFAVTNVVQSDLTARPALVTSSFGNPELHAEKGEEYELGFDGSFLNGRIGVDFTFYNKLTKDALIPVPAAPSSGFTASVLQNVGEISNRGTELALDILAVETENFTWTSRVSHSTNRNRLESWGGVRDEPIFTGFSLTNVGVRIAEGAPLGQFYGTVPSVDPVTGELLRDAQGNLIVTRDTVYFGNNQPTRTLSWDNTFRVFRNLALGFQLDHQGGLYQINLTRRTRTLDQVTRETVDPAADSLQRRILLSGAGAQWIEKADFVKLREISASYTLPSRFARRMGGEAVILTVSARNLKTWTDYTGTDPEVNAAVSDFTLAETNSIPPTRRVTASVTVRF
ncbi:MAG TPA: SusC/RagA family TonB-linked outer membrane protein [Longimicrobium sp.]